MNIRVSRSERLSRGLPAARGTVAGGGYPAAVSIVCSRQPARVQPRDYTLYQLADWRPVSILLSCALHADQRGMEKMRELAQVVRERANVVHG